MVSQKKDKNSVDRAKGRTLKYRDVRLDFKKHQMMNGRTKKQQDLCKLSITD